MAAPATRADERILDILCRVPVFAGISRDALLEIRRLGAFQSFPPRTIIFREDDPGDAMFLIISGRVQILKDAHGHSRNLSVRASGDLIGEMALLEDKPRSATCVTTRHTKVFRIPKESFRRILVEKPSAALEIMTSLSCRLRETQDDLVRDLSRKNKELERFNALLERKVARTTKELRMANRRLREMSIRDGLTGVYNRRYFNELIDSVDEKSGESTRIGIVLFDIDHFKRLNDTHGHQAGDRVLAELAGVIEGHLGRGHLIARYGGEEFVVVLRRAGKRRAAALAEELRRLIELHSFPLRNFRQGGEVTVSIGVAAYPGDGEALKDVVHAADCALYAAKRGGRNRVVLYDRALHESD